MKNTTKKNLFGYLAIALALTMVIGASTMMSQKSASAEQVQLAENATVVSSPFTDAVQKVKNSVVGVNNYTSARNNSYYYGYGYGFNGRGNNSQSDADTSRQVLQSSGSGVVVAKGYVVTNYHVVEGATSLEITSGDNTYAATVAGYDESIDVAVLSCPTLDLEAVVLGDSDVLNVGDWAICIGNPLSFTGTTTVGVISALNREITTSSTTDAYGYRSAVTNQMIQTDAAINAGNSGGGMFNVAGELIGIPSRKYTGSYYSTSTVEGIGMAIPVNVVKPLLEKVLSGETVANGDEPTPTEEPTVNNDATTSNKPRIGVTVTNATNFSSYAVSAGVIPNGAYVTEVEDGSPAAKAGIQAGDIVVDVDGNVITSTSQMIEILQAKQAGDEVAVKLWRSEGITEAQSVSDIKEGAYMDMTVSLAMLDNVKQ